MCMLQFLAPFFCCGVSENEAKREGTCDDACVSVFVFIFVVCIVVYCYPSSAQMKSRQMKNPLKKRSTQRVGYSLQFYYEKKKIKLIIPEFCLFFYINLSYVSF